MDVWQIEDLEPDCLQILRWKRCIFASGKACPSRGICLQVM
jgi:hypothetical protein